MGSRVPGGLVHHLCARDRGVWGRVTHRGLGPGVHGQGSTEHPEVLKGEGHSALSDEPRSTCLLHVKVPGAHRSQVTFS